MSFYRVTERLLKCIRQEKRYVILFAVIIVMIMLTTQSEESAIIPVARPAIFDARTVKITPSATEELLPSEEFFNSSYLIDKTIKELKLDGWVAPIGQGGVARRISKLKATLPRRTNRLLSSKPAEQVLLERDRWKVSYVGCFYNDEKLPVLTPRLPRSPATSVESCISTCDNQGQIYAAITGGNSCTCGKAVTKPAVHLFAHSRTICDIKCKQEGDQRPCGGMRHTSVYKITLHEKQNLTLSGVHDVSFGCFIKPTSLEQDFVHRRVLTNGTAAHCIVHCEESLQTIAAWDPQSKECMCGKFNSRLPLRRLVKSPNNDLCEEKYCKSTENCKARYVKLFRTYFHDTRCEARRFLFDGNGTLTALASFPGSGNTWVRYLIESATGVYSGSVYSDTELYKKGFLGEALSWKSRRTSVIKTHEGSRKGSNIFEAVVLLVRDPYDAFMAEFNRIAGGHVGHADPKLFKTKEWTYYVVYKLRKWLDVVRHYSKLKKVHVSFFEDIVRDPIREIRAINRFLGFTVTNFEDRLECLLSNTGGNFKRKSRKLDFDPYTSFMKANANLFVKKARKILEDRGLPRLPDYER